MHDVLRIVKRRAKEAALPENISCHTFRATGLPDFVEHGGTPGGGDGSCVA